MLIQFLIFFAVVLGALVFYINYIAPGMNPIKKAQSYLDQNLVDEAILEYKKTLDRDPQNCSAHYKLAEIFLNKKNDPDQCVVHLETIINNNKYNYEVEKQNVQKMLAACYHNRGEIDQAFHQYVEILRVYPGDYDSLYHAAFISLGQEYFDAAQRFFDRLTGMSKKNFEILFGAGIASYQNQRTAEASVYFKDALSIDPHSDIGNLAMAFALYGRRDYKTAINYVKMIVDSSKDEAALFIARRFLALLHFFTKNPQSGVKILQELLAYTRENDMNDEAAAILYDLGFLCLGAEMTHDAYEYWNDLYQIDRNYKNLQHMITILRREMADLPKMESIDSSALGDYYEKWREDLFPENFVWEICGLKNENFFDIKNSIVTLRNVSTKEHGAAVSSQSSARISDDEIDRFFAADPETFRIASNRLVGKIGYKVDEILPTYREHDGVDFLALSTVDKSKTLVWVRRWKGTNIGEIPLRNFAQAVNDSKAKKGIFITATPLTPTGESAAGRLSKIEIIGPDRLAEYLTDLI